MTLLLAVLMLTFLQAPWWAYVGAAVMWLGSLWWDCEVAGKNWIRL